MAPAITRRGFFVTRGGKPRFFGRSPLAIRLISGKRAGRSGGRKGRLRERSKRDFDMNKNDLVTQVAEKASLTKAQAGEAVDAVFDVISGALKAGDEVRIVGFGNFVVTERAATKGRNPQTKEEIDIPASKQPKFRAGKGLKDAVNG
ncbi:HU family DNA-binding protein [Chthonobacter albigriseus]